MRTFESRNQISSGGLPSHNDYRAGLVRLDPAGEVLWARTLDYPANGVTMFQVLPVDSGGVLITLSCEFKGAGTFIAFVDDTGELKWARVFNRPNVTLLPILETAERPKLDTLLVSAMEVRRAPVPGMRCLVMVLDPGTGDILHQTVLPKRFSMAAFSLRDSDGGLLLSMMGVDMMSRKFHAGVAKVSGSLEPSAGISIMNAERDGGAFNLPNGTVVEVAGYFHGNNPDLGDIAKIVWGNGAHTGYVYKFELTRDRYVGSR